VAAQHPAADLPLPQLSLSAEERAAAVAAAVPYRPSLSAMDLLPGRERRLVVASVDLAGNPEKDGTGRFALVTLYLYDGGITVRRLVDVRNGEIVREATAENDTPPLARAEAEFARALALADPLLAERLSPWRDEVEVEALVSATSDAADPLYRHRVVTLLFRTPEGYLATVGEVLVDLADGRVLMHPERR
jgi:hypothetical protein